MRATLLFGTVAFFLSSCSFHANNWRGAEQPGQLQAAFDYFNGKNKQTITLTKGAYLFTDYKMTAASGKLKLAITYDNKALWEKQFEATTDTTGFYIVAPEAGQYAIVVSGDRATGSYDVHFNATEAKKVGVKISRNVELYGLITALDMGSDLLASKDTTMIDGRKATWRQWYAMTLRNYLQYRQFDTCQIMTIYRKMPGYFYDFYVDFLLQVDEAPFAKITSGTDQEAYIGFSPTGDTAEARQKANAFLGAFNAFYKAVDFDAYLSRNKRYYELAQASVLKNLPGDYLLPVMEHYYRQQFNNYYLVPSLNIPTSMGFGKINRTTRTVYNTFGPFSFQSFDNTHEDMGFDYPEKIKVLAVHEFGHPFANPAVDKLPKALMDSTKYLYEPIKKAMTERAYNQWRSCLYEHFVKAGEAIVAEKIGDTARVQVFMQDAVKAGFIYVPFIVDELKKWDKNYSAAVSFDEAVLNTVRKLDAQYRK
jgi:hypothetical protein